MLYYSGCRLPNHKSAEICNIRSAAAAVNMDRSLDRWIVGWMSIIAAGRFQNGDLWFMAMQNTNLHQPRLLLTSAAAGLHTPNSVPECNTIKFRRLSRPERKSRECESNFTCCFDAVLFSTMIRTVIAI